MTTLAASLVSSTRAPPSVPAPAGGTRLTLTRDGETWRIALGGDEVRLKDSKGLGYLEALVRSPHREIHVTDLVHAGAELVEQADGGPVIDAEAKRQYERRLRDLEEDLREAEEFGDRARASRAEAEIDALTEELARAYGLGGRERRLGSLTERARINVQRRLKDVIGRIAKSSPELGRHLDDSVQTGTFCAYAPRG
jgi:hypothetical protein